MSPFPFVVRLRYCAASQFSDIWDGIYVRLAYSIVEHDDSAVLGDVDVCIRTKRDEKRQIFVFTRARGKRALRRIERREMWRRSIEQDREKKSACTCAEWKR